MKIANNVNPPLAETLSHHGVKGMHWGVRKAKHTNAEIRGAQKRQETRINKVDQAVENASLATSSKQIDRHLAVAAKNLKELNSSEDRVVAEKMTTGQKIATGLLGGPIGLIIVATNHHFVDTAAKNTDAFRRTLK